MIRRFCGPVIVFIAVLLTLACGGAGSQPPDPDPAVTSVAFLPDPREFLLQFVDVTVIQERCTYRDDLGQADCGDFGKYSPAPPPTGEGVLCRVLLVDKGPVAVVCSIQEPAEILYYAIEGVP